MKKTLKEAQKAERQFRLPADTETHESFRRLLADALDERFGYDMEAVHVFLDSFEAASC
jgi:hypothetical protein